MVMIPEAPVKESGGERHGMGFGTGSHLFAAPGAGYLSGLRQSAVDFDHARLRPVPGNGARYHAINNQNDADTK